MQCNFLTGILDLVYLLIMFTEETAASWMLELFGEVVRGVPEYFSYGAFSINDVVKSYREKTVLKTLQLEFSQDIHLFHV